MLLDELGWGAMPLHTLEGDIAQGRLTIIQPEDFDPPYRFVMNCGYLADQRPGPAAHWLLRDLLENGNVS